MKSFFRSLWQRIKNFFKWLWQQLKDWRTLIIFIIVLLVMYFPAYGFYIFSVIFENGWFAAAATAYMAFWAGPFTPFFPLCIAITLAIKRIIFKISNHKNKSAQAEQDKIDETTQAANTQKSVKDNGEKSENSENDTTEKN